jgi:hypothetical protein
MVITRLQKQTINNNKFKKNEKAIINKQKKNDKK